MNSKFQDHLGDGVYAEWDGYAVILRVNHHEDPNPICLDPYVLAAFDRYRIRIAEEMRLRRDKKEE